MRVETDEKVLVPGQVETLQLPVAHGPVVGPGVQGHALELVQRLDLDRAHERIMPEPRGCAGRG